MNTKFKASLGKKKNKKLRKKGARNVSCWKGYHRVKGTVSYSKKSCVKNKK